MDNIIIGTRGSVLAIWQANFIKDKLKTQFNLDSKLEIIKTTGDKFLDAPLSKIGGKGLFTKEIEEKLLNNEITLAVHSLKDVPINIPSSLTLAAITKREDIRDCFLSNKFSSLESLPKGAKVGTTSLRRAMQLKYIRNDLETLNLRGNVQTRLQKLSNNEFDAIILAKAGVNRLGISNKDIKFITPFESYIIIPAMGQGSLGIECREDCEILDTLKKLNDNKSFIECSLEREFIKYLNGGCQVPIGVNAIYQNDNNINMTAIIGLPNGKKIIKDNVSGSLNDNLALKLFNKVNNNGAKQVLKEALEMVESF
ncbi:hydroxymethylbilane synthase [Helicobacter sp. MIT 14-3879]|uniref:hydroxymethylbilane synthase n=1 Tax=Helicobacter sp. MIT 14-3879 TaxID=2040649 RepID=UPI000E1E4A4E|nr:hydroxymethylbilane synthase [Helicobacter sp. MIT 14-3879]RDU63492.1 hydroxymethylbilane synthase [Helicobacter sp. MIT 14-3879]